jgi:hypothetical protein
MQHQICPHKDESGSKSDKIPDPPTVETWGDDEALEELLPQLMDADSMVVVPATATDTPNDNSYQNVCRKALTTDAV